MHQEARAALVNLCVRCTYAHRRSPEHMSTLYQRLGAANGIAALVDDIVDAHLKNLAIQARYQSLAEDSQRFDQAKQHLRDFLGAGTGGPEQYQGRRDMIETHRGMNVSAADLHVSRTNR